MSTPQQQLSGPSYQPGGFHLPPVPGTSGDSFLAGQYLPVTSSNVAGAQYDRDRQILTVDFLPKDGRPATSYEVSGVTEQEAADFERAPSKGEWYWQHVRVRGSKTAHQKTVRKVK